MRDIGLARRQFLTGLGLTILSGVLGLVVLLPQYQQYLRNLSRSQEVWLHKPPVLQSLPEVSAENTKTWQTQVVDKLNTIGLKTHALVAEVDGSPKQMSYRIKAFPEALQNIPLQLTLHGTAPAIQKYLESLNKSLPGLEIQNLAMKRLPSLTSKSGPSPLFKAVIQCDLLVLKSPSSEQSAQ